MGIGRGKKLSLQALPRFEDGCTFLYTERSRVERDENGLVLANDTGLITVPSALVSALLLGPGSSLTHAAACLLAENGCSMVFVGEDGVRSYASGSGETRFSANIMRQAELWANRSTHQDVVVRMYRMRFSESLDPTLSIEQIRGKEGVRVREAYANASRKTGVPWSGRSYEREAWGRADPVNRALSAANACLYGLCHAAIVATGFSPALGFVHTGKALSFVYDVADLYKVDVTVPAAFAVAAEGSDDIERRVRIACRRAFYEKRLLARIVPDIQVALGMKPESARVWIHGVEDGVGGLWDPHTGEVPGGQNYGDAKTEEEDPT